MLSFKKYQVKTGNNKSPMHEPMKRADQTEPIESDRNFHPNQKQTLVGIPNTRADVKGFSDHQSHIN